MNDRLVACGQLLGPIRSIYRWDNAVQADTEVRAALHTRESLVPAIIERTRAEHPYEAPCVLVLPVQNGNPEYLAWVVESTSGS